VHIAFLAGCGVEEKLADRGISERIGGFELFLAMLAERLLADLKDRGDLFPWNTKRPCRNLRAKSDAKENQLFQSVIVSLSSVSH
jgi:hypothetical protein